MRRVQLLQRLRAPRRKLDPR